MHVNGANVGNICTSDIPISTLRKRLGIIAVLSYCAFNWHEEDGQDAHPTKNLSFWGLSWR